MRAGNFKTGLARSSRGVLYKPFRGTDLYYTSMKGLAGVWCSRLGQGGYGGKGLQCYWSHTGCGFNLYEFMIK